MFNRESKAISGVQPQMDDTDKQAVSAYIYSGGLTLADGDSNSPTVAANFASARLRQIAYGFLCNGSSWDRFHNNLSLTLLASAARTATTYSADQTNYNANAALFIFDVTAVPGTDTVQLIVQIKDPVSGKYVTVLDGTAESAAGTYIYAVGLGVVDGESKFDAIEGIALPRTWRIGVAHSAATSFTYSVGGFLIN